MKKVLFLMFLLFLIGLGTAHVNAQVRIGGNAAPNRATVLDLNATDAATGTKGLALPRVNLTSNTMQITTGVANLAGMMVYNTSTILGAGIYSWIGGVWKKVDAVPAPTPADSGFYLMSNGSSSVWRSWALVGDTSASANINVTVHPDTIPVTFTVILDTTISMSIKLGAYASVFSPAGFKPRDFCNGGSWNATGLVYAFNSGNRLLIWNMTRAALPFANYTIRCYRPSH